MSVVVPNITTERLVLREWLAVDREPFARINADERVMEHFPSTLDAADSDALVDRFESSWREGLAPWAVAERATGSFVGFVGFMAPTWSAHFTPCIEIGWRFAASHWGRGLATEGARAALDWARAALRPPRNEIVSFTTVGNRRSRRVMEKLGFHHDPSDDFDHPNLPDWEHKRHVLYRIRLERS